MNERKHQCTEIDSYKCKSGTNTYVSPTYCISIWNVFSQNPTQVSATDRGNDIATPRKFCTQVQVHLGEEVADDETSTQIPDDKKFHLDNRSRNKPARLITLTE